MSDFQGYMLAQAHKNTAMERYNYAGAALDNARIKERLAMIKSQSEPLKMIAEMSLSDRDKLYAAAYFVVTGRMPG